MKKPGTISAKSFTKAASSTTAHARSLKSRSAQREGKEIYSRKIYYYAIFTPVLAWTAFRWLPANMSLLFRWLGF